MSANTTFISAPGTLNEMSFLEAFSASVSFCDSAEVKGFHPLSERHSQLTSSLVLFAPSSLLTEELDVALAVKRQISIIASGCEINYNSCERGARQNKVWRTLTYNLFSRHRRVAGVCVVKLML